MKLLIPNINGAIAEVWKWISNFIPYYTVNVITYPLLNHVIKTGPKNIHMAWLFLLCCCRVFLLPDPYDTDSKVHEANMGPTWVLSAPDGPHVVPMNLGVWGFIFLFATFQPFLVSDTLVATRQKSVDGFGWNRLSTNHKTHSNSTVCMCMVVMHSWPRTV